jgi:hypothetical protein
MPTASLPSTPSRLPTIALVALVHLALMAAWNSARRPAQAEAGIQRETQFFWVKPMAPSARAIQPGIKQAQPPSQPPPKPDSTPKAVRPAVESQAI